jgi:hypothetical protein
VVHGNPKLQRLLNGDLMCAWFVNKSHAAPQRQPYLLFNPDSWEVQR